VIPNNAREMFRTVLRRRSFSGGTDVVSRSSSKAPTKRSMAVKMVHPTGSIVNQSWCVASRPGMEHVVCSFLLHLQNLDREDR